MSDFKKCPTCGTTTNTPGYWMHSCILVIRGQRDKALADLAKRDKVVEADMCDFAILEISKTGKAIVLDRDTLVFLMARFAGIKRGDFTSAYEAQLAIHQLEETVDNE